MLGVTDKSQVVGKFLDWLNSEKGIVLARWVSEDGRDELCPDYTSYERLLADFFEIDLVAVENEKRSILAQLRKATSKPRV